MFTKKGQVEKALLGVIPVVLIFIFLGIVLASSQKVMTTIKNTGSDNVGATSNVSFTFQNNTVLGFTGRALPGSESLFNGSGITLASSNYEIFYGTDDLSAYIKFINNTNTMWNTSTNGLILQATYLIGSQERNITRQGQLANDTISKFQPTWATIVAISILLGLLITLLTLVYYKFKG